MKKLRPLIFIVILAILFSCEKEYSEENLTTGDESIVGADCRIRKIAFRDTSGMAAGGRGFGLGSIEAKINFDIVTRITQFDSTGGFIVYDEEPVYTNDSIYISPEEYFIVDVNKRIIKSHLLADPTDPVSSPRLNVFYVYNTAGYLVQKNYFSTTTPGFPYQRVDYTYTSPGNLTRMTSVDLPTGDLNMDAEITYNPNIVARRFIYTFPDERYYPEYTQFFNFGARNFNAPKTMKVRNYDPGNTVRDSLVSTFSNYFMSRDSYVLSAQLDTAQPSIPALAGKLSFTYSCK